jgi:DNA-binding phage protein
MVVFALLGFIAKSSGMTVAKVAEQSGMYLSLM